MQSIKSGGEYVIYVSFSLAEIYRPGALGISGCTQCMYALAPASAVSPDMRVLVLSFQVCYPSRWAPRRLYPSSSSPTHRSACRFCRVYLFLPLFCVRSQDTCPFTFLSPRSRSVYSPLRVVPLALPTLSYPTTAPALERRAPYHASRASIT